MTRIISGFAGSLSLAVPPTGTRPTSDRVREAIFSALEARDLVDGARVLDLYAGSGALGLEAASRGAAHVTLVENGAAALKACRKNAALLLTSVPRGAALQIEVSGQAVQSFLTGTGGLFDIVFLDPPYGLNLGELQANLDALVPLLSPDAVVVLERGSRDPEPDWSRGLELDRRKAYGDTVLFWASLA